MKSITRLVQVCEKKSFKFKRKIEYEAIVDSYHSQSKLSNLDGENRHLLGCVSQHFRRFTSN